MLFSLGLLCLVVICGVLGGMLVNRRVRTWQAHFRLLAVLVPGGLLFAAVLCVCRVLDVADFDWNQARLAPLFGLRDGYSLYYSPEQGPITGTVLGPLAYLSYFPSLIANTPVPALLIGSLTASFYYLAPVIWSFLFYGPFRRKEGRAMGLFLILIFVLWTIGIQPLNYSGFHIHADAPAFGLAGAACAWLMREKEGLKRPYFLRLLFGATLAVLAVYSKQSVIFVLPALACFLWVVDGWRAALEFGAASIVLLFAVFGVFATLFGAHALFFNIYGYPSHHGFGTGYMVFPTRGLGAALAVMVQTGRKVWDYGEWVVAALALCYIVEAHLNRGNISVREWLRKNRWTVFHFVALAGLPASVVFGAKVGADTNHYSLFLYFAIVGLLLFIGHLTLENGDVARPMVAASVILLAALIPSAMISIDVPSLIRKLYSSHTEQVYEYETKHPGEVYFSFFPLPTLMAEGRLYHFEYGLFDRELGRARVSDAHFLQYVPPHMKYVQRYPENSPMVEYLPQFACEVQEPVFQGLSIYGKCGSGEAR